MLNNVVLVGRLTRDPELRYTGGGTAVASAAIAIDRAHREQGSSEATTAFININVWGQQAERFSGWAKKGSLIGVTGRIQTGNYVNQQGQRVNTFEVVVSNFQLLESRAASENRAAGGFAPDANFGAPTANFGTPEPSAPSTPNFAREESPFGGNPMDISDDDLPF